MTPHINTRGEAEAEAEVKVDGEEEGVLTSPADAGDLASKTTDVAAEAMLGRETGQSSVLLLVYIGLRRTIQCQTARA
jgi:hypothetical protein